MTLPHLSRPYEHWAPVLGRILLGGLFLMGAVYKIPGTSGFTNEVAMSAAAGIPLASIAVFLAFVLEVVGGLALIFGWKTRLFAFLLMLFTALLAVIFYRDFSNPMVMGMFVSHLGLIGGLLYASTYGSQYAAVQKCPLPQGLSGSM